MASFPRNYSFGRTASEVSFLLGFTDEGKRRVETTDYAALREIGVGVRGILVAERGLNNVPMLAVVGLTTR